MPGHKGSHVEGRMLGSENAQNDTRRTWEPFSRTIDDTTHAITVGWGRIRKTRGIRRGEAHDAMHSCHFSLLPRHPAEPNYAFGHRSIYG